MSAVAGDSHKNAEVRRALQPLADLAALSGCAVVGITHFTKGTGGRDPVERLTGSLAFGAVARVVLVAAKIEDTGEEEHSGIKPSRVLMRAKCSIGPDGGGFRYDIEQIELLPDHPGIITSKVKWGEAVQGTARELLAEAESTDDEAGEAVTSAMEWLRNLLASGPMNATEVKDKAKGMHAWATVRRAQKRLGIRSVKSGMDAGWKWCLSEDAHEKPEDAQQNKVGAFGNSERLRAGGADADGFVEGTL